MRTIACLAALLAMTACSEAATEEPAAEETVAAPVEVSNEDGTFTHTDAAGEVTTGTWTEAEPGKFCETVDGTERCSTETMVDGVWTSTNADGEVSTIERVET